MATYTIKGKISDLNDTPLSNLTVRCDSAVQRTLRLAACFNGINILV